jgi:hypothetical protein
LMEGKKQSKHVLGQLFGDHVLGSIHDIQQVLWDV